MRKKIIHLCIALFVIGCMAGLYFWQTRRDLGEDVDESSRNFPAISINLISRFEEDVVEVAFYFQGSRSFMRPYYNEAGELRWGHSHAPGYVLDHHLAWDKARLGWQVAAVYIAHEDTADLELSAFGLDPPIVVVESTFRDGGVHTIKIGSATTDLDQHFAMVDDDSGIFLINTVLAQRAMSGPEDLLDVTLPRFNMHEADFIRLAQRGRPSIVLGRRGPDVPPSPLQGLMQGGPDGWHLMIHEPIPGLELNQFDLFDNLFAPLNAMRVHSVASLHPVDLAPYGLDDPFIEVEYRDAWGEARILFGDSSDRDGMIYIYVMVVGRPHVFYVPLWHIQELIGLDILDIAERLISSVNIWDVERITIEYPRGAFDMVLNHVPGENALEPTINGVEVEDAMLRVGYRLIISLSADGDVAPHMPEGEPEVTVTHHRVDGTEIELRFFSYGHHFFVVSIDGEPAQFAVGRRDVEVMLGFIGGLVG